MKFILGAHEAAVQARVRALASAGAAERIWRRDARFWDGDAERERSVDARLGWLDVGAGTRGRAGELDEFARSVAAAGFRDAVVLGMGGSSLAPEVLARTFGPYARSLRLHVLDTTDPATILAVRRAVDPAATLFIVSSKSGTTIEAISLFEYFHAIVAATRRERAGDSFVAITDEGTPLQTLAQQHGFRRVFINPGDIGGRYSALSYFGAVPAALAGIDVARLLDRGVAAAAEARAPDSEALRLGATLGELARAGRDKCTLIVSPGVASLALWLEQLIAESTGKLGRGILPVAGEPLGSPRQYADDRVFVQLRLEADNTGEDDAAVGGLAAEGHPVIVLEMEDAHDLGRQFFLWEFAIAVAGHVLEINPFDEPNVQESKDNTNRVLRDLASRGTLDEPGNAVAGPVALSGGGTPSEDVRGAVAQLLTQLRAHDYLAITAYTPQTAAADALFADVRALIRNERRVATTLGYGPRFLHSTGQLHKGGAPQGVFLQVTAPDAEDLPVPGKQFTFGQLKRAQSIGDFQSLLAHGRPVLRIHLGADVEAGLRDLRDAIRGAVNRPGALRR